MIQTFFCEPFFGWVIPMTSSMSISKMEGKITRGYVSWKRTFFLDFDYGIVLLDEIPICILSSFSPSTMGRSGNVHTIKITRGYDSRYSDMKNFRFFAPDITNHITHMHTSFVFSFSSHVTRKLSQEKSSYRLWI